MVWTGRKKPTDLFSDFIFFGTFGKQTIRNWITAIEEPEDERQRRPQPLECAGYNGYWQ